MSQNAVAAIKRNSLISKYHRQSLIIAQTEVQKSTGEMSVSLHPG